MTIPATMRAVTVEGGKGPRSALRVEHIPTPKPPPGHVLIKTHAAGVNWADVVQRQGNYPPPPGASEIIGLEVAGEVVALGEQAPRWHLGDRVTALLPGGGYAEYATVDARHALPIPEHLSFEEAGALPETVFTVFTNLFERGRLQEGETVLIHGANSGIGVTAILLAKAAGARVIATARSPEKCTKAMEAGADRAINVKTQDFAAVVNELGGADVVLDIVGGDYFAKNIDALKLEGRLVQVASLAGAKVEVDLLRLMFKRLTLTASTLRARTPDEKARLAAAIETTVWPWVEAGKVKLPVDKQFSFEQVADAHAWLETGSQFGKVVLVP